MATSDSGDNPERLLLQLVRHVLHKSGDEDVTPQYQYALRLLSSNFTPTVEGDDFQVAQRIRKKLANQNRDKDAAKFSELYTKLKSKSELKNKWAILYVLMSLADSKRHGGNKTFDKSGVFWRGLPRMATSTPFPSRPTTAENTEESISDPYGATTIQPTHHTMSSGIGSGISSISNYTGSVTHGQGYISTPGLPGITPAVTRSAPGQYGVTFADQTPGSRLARMLSDTTISRNTHQSIAPQPSQRFAETDKDSEIAESILVRDLVYNFQGIDGHVVKFSHTEDAFRINPEVVVSKPKRDLTHKLSELGWLFMKVRKYIDRRSQDKAFGVIGQSFCAALQQELTEYYRLLAVLQAQVEHEADLAVEIDPSDTLSLIRLKVWTFDPTDRMRYLAILVDGCKDKKGGALCSSVESYTWHGDPAVRSLMKHILKAVALPVRSMLDKWIYEGELEDKYHEFFVASDPTVKEEKLWHEKYSLRKSMIPSFITKEQANKILSIGKTINFLRHVCKNNEPIKGKSDDLSTEFATDIFRDTEMLLEQDMDSSFQRVIDTVYQDTSKRLLHVLHEDFKFLDHLKAMRRYLLLGQGDFIQHLLDLLQSDLAKPASSLYLHNLTGVLETAIRATNAQFDDIDTLNRLDVRLLQISPGDAGWDVFSLDYHVDGPISTVFTPQCKLLYLRVFNFLWRAKRMDYVLNQIWREQMSNAKVVKSIPELSPVLHQCHILAAEMIHFVQQMQYYINFEVMECSWDELWKKVAEAEDLDHIIAAHEVFLDTIIRRALLDQQSRPLLTQLRAIFDLIIQFQGTQENFFTSSLEELALREAYEKEIAAKTKEGEWGTSQQSEEDERRRKVKFMREVIPTNRAQLKVLAKSYQDMVQKFLVSLTEHADDSLRLLAVRLDFNEVYKMKEPKLRSPMAFGKSKKIF